MKMLVGYSGFVGSNLCKTHSFDELYNSKNITDAYGKNPELLVYSGVPAQKFLANKDPKKDFEIIENAIHNIKEINPKEIVLISTIDVYKNPNNIDENKVIETDNLQPYGYNRYVLEKWISENIKNYLIIHLPGLYGENIKKNFIYDLIHIIPSMLTEEKYSEILSKNKSIKDYYINQNNGFYKIKELNNSEEKMLKDVFSKIGFSALNFTDSRGVFQFYNLKYLWEHIEIARQNNLKVLNLATEPVSISDIYRYIKGNDFINEISSNVPYYNFKTKYDYLFKGKDGYIFDRNFVLEDIKRFIEENENK